MAHFRLGQVLATPTVLAKFATNKQSFLPYLDRHRGGDWGEVDQHDSKANFAAIVSGARILSSYRLNDGTKFWIITDATDDQGNRASTTLLLPEEY